MIAAANAHLWWPYMNGNITSKRLNCLHCQQLRKLHNPLFPVNKHSYLVSIMEHLSANYFSIRHQYLLVMGDKMSAFIWANRYTAKSTTNTLAMIRPIIRAHDRPKIVIEDCGPEFRGDSVNQLHAMDIDHCCSKAFQYLKNGWAEPTVQTIHAML